jgi:hypothetical protein
VSVAALVALEYRRLMEAAAWCRAGLATATDERGVLTLLALRAALLSFLGDDRQSLALCRGVWAALELPAPGEGGDEDRTAVWADPVWVAALVAFHAGWAEASAGNQGSASVWLSRLGELTDRIPVEEGIARQHYLGCWIAERRGDFAAARQYVLGLRDLVTYPEALWQANVHNNLAVLDLRLGERAAAQARFTGHVEEIIGTGDPLLVLTAIETLAEAILPEHPLLCARAMSAVARERVAEGIPHYTEGADEVAQIIERARSSVEPDAWDAAWARGEGEDVTALFREMAALPSTDSGQEA